MPARRLPWFKLWPEAMRHEKVALLSDSAFRSWIVLLAAASEQATRWRFASVHHAARVTGRPEDDLRELIGARLLDVAGASGEVWIHDWRQWQERFPSDLTPRMPRNGSANAPHSLPPEERREKREGRRETGEPSSPLPPPPPNALRAAEEGEWQKGAKKRSSEIPVLAQPLTPVDELLWATALIKASVDMSATNADMLARLEPLGRSADGAMLLRAPPGQGFERFRGTLVRSLLDAGDDQAKQLVIFEG